MANAGRLRFDTPLRRVPALFCCIFCRCVTLRRRLLLHTLFCYNVVSLLRRSTAAPFFCYIVCCYTASLLRPFARHLDPAYIYLWVHTCADQGPLQTLCSLASAPPCPPSLIHLSLTLLAPHLLVPHLLAPSARPFLARSSAVPLLLFSFSFAHFLTRSLLTLPPHPQPTFSNHVSPHRSGSGHRRRRRRPP